MKTLQRTNYKNLTEKQHNSIPLLLLPSWPNVYILDSHLLPNYRLEIRLTVVSLQSHFTALQFSPFTTF